MSRGSKGFTLIESLVAVVLLALGVVATLNGFAGVTRVQARLEQKTLAERLAAMKIDELLATGEASQAPLNGTFQEEGQPAYRWEAESGPSGIENLNYLTVTVTDNNQDGAAASLNTLWYLPPQTTDTGAEQ